MPSVRVVQLIKAITVIDPINLTGKNILTPELRRERIVKSMFAQIIQRLTLIAFTVHAVLGCCAHHSHAQGGECCEHVSAHRCDSHGAYEAEHALDDCTHEHECPEVPASGGVVQNPAACGCDLPCDHSHSCNETRCAYVIPSTTTVDFDADVFFCVLDLASSNKSILGPSVCTNLRTCWPAHLWHSSSAQLCADLQSWQI